MAGTVRPRSRTVATIRISVPGKASGSTVIRGTPIGVRYSIETTAVASYSLISSTREFHEPGLRFCDCSRSDTARTWRFHVGPGNRTCCSARRARLALSRPWMNVVPDFIRPMWNTTRCAMPTVCQLSSGCPEGCRPMLGSVPGTEPAEPHGLVARGVVGRWDDDLGADHGVVGDVPGLAGPVGDEPEEVEAA